MQLAIDTHSVRIASYNIHLGIGRDGQFSPERIARVIAELGADVVALQEVGMGAPGFNMLQYLRDATGMHGIAGPTLVTRHGDYGNAILTRFPATRVRQLDVSVARHEPRGALDITVDCAGRALRLIATHFGLWPGERRIQARKILVHVDDVPTAPVVLTGDLNEWFLWGRPLRWLHRHFGHSPMPATFPSGRPIFALDRLWVKPALALRQVDVHKSPRSRLASDHLPITAVVDLSGI